MWRELGIVRRGEMIEDAMGRIDFWTRAVLELAPPEPRAWELLNMLTIARLAAQSAHAREESRGTHYRADFPEPRDEWHVHTVLEAVVEGESIRGLSVARQPVVESA
jgi:aspartate oxidase